MAKRSKAGINKQNKGSRNERRAKKELEQDGYYVSKAGGSLGLWDLVCFDMSHLRLIQVKTNYCRVAEREQLKEFEAPDFAVKELWVYKDRVAVAEKTIIE